MTQEEWDRICDFVTEAMRQYTRPLVTPLMDKKNLVGSGNYVLLNDQTFIATCEHVAKYGRLDYRFYGLEKEFNNHGEWTMDPLPIDLAIAPLLHDQWDNLDHQAKVVRYDQLAQRHAPFDCHEIMFFRGYAGENSPTPGIFSEANSTAYSSQVKKETSNARYFEVFWEPGKTQYTTATTEEERIKFKYENPKGFSGSLVWNTRYREVTAAQKQWTPEEAIVTGMVHRWDDIATTLLVYRVEHIRNFISAKLNPLE